MEKHRPTSRALVVRGGPTAPEAVRETLDLGDERFEVAPLDSRKGGMVIEFDAEPAEVKNRWRAVQTQLGDQAMVSPVLEDSVGDAHYPTGEVTVRFATPPDDETVALLEDTFGLAVARRNPFVPSQLTFAPKRPGAAYLPELIDAVAKAGGVRAAWAATESKLRRGDDD